MSTDFQQRRIGIVGYGEVGRILGEDLRARGHAVAAYDLCQDTLQGAVMREHAQSHGVTLAADYDALAERSDLIISAVTANQTESVARAVGIRPGAIFLDLNSASPGAKQRAAAAIAAAGGRYVEGAVMTSVPPFRIAVPLLVGGPHARDALPELQQLGFAAEYASDEPGVASATKMCRSIIIKGLESLVIESFSAARAYGVEDAVIDSLRETFPELDWEKQGSYFFQRVIQHGRRRAEELREVANTVRDCGLLPLGATAIARRMDWMADLADQGLFGQRGEPRHARSADWRVEADRLITHVKDNS